jgi:hypothetical protein
LSARADKRLRCGAVGQDGTGTGTGAAQRAATAMPAPCSPRWLMSTGHVGLANFVQLVNRRCLTSPVAPVWLNFSRAERFSHLQVLTENLGGFWSMDDDEVEPGEVSGVIHDERTTNWSSLKGFG